MILHYILVVSWLCILMMFSFFNHFLIKICRSICPYTDWSCCFLMLPQSSCRYYDIVIALKQNRPSQDTVLWSQIKEYNTHLLTDVSNTVWKYIMTCAEWRVRCCIPTLLHLAANKVCTPRRTPRRQTKRPLRRHIRIHKSTMPIISCDCRHIQVIRVHSQLAGK